MKKKTIQLTMSVETGADNYSICDFVEKILQNSTLNSSEFKLEIQETKVIKSEEI